MRLQSFLRFLHITKVELRHFFCPRIDTAQKSHVTSWLQIAVWKQNIFCTSILLQVAFASHRLVETPANSSGN